MTRSRFSQVFVEILLGPIAGCLLVVVLGLLAILPVYILLILAGKIF